MTHGFILTKRWRDTPTGVELEFWLKTDLGPVRLVVNNQHSVFFIKTADLPSAKQLLTDIDGWQHRSLALKTFNQQPVSALYFKQHHIARQASQKLTDAGVTTYESDIKPSDRFLMERFITASLSFLPEKNGSPVSLDSKATPVKEALFPHFETKTCRKSNYQTPLTAVSLDIETSYNGSELYCIGVSSAESDCVWMLESDIPKCKAMENAPSFIKWCTDERQLLTAFIDWLHHHDPDLIIGWNVINFDLRFLEQKAKELQLPLLLGRNRSRAHWIQNFNNKSRYTVTIPGRVAIDGIDLLKNAAYPLKRYSLEHVARHFLGEGKIIEVSQHRGEAIKTLFYTDKTALARYNLQDCVLVWKIFERADLFNFAVSRSQLTGLDMNRMGGSVAAFENLYLAKMHRAGYVAPNLNSNQSTILAPGGYVLDSRPGLYKNVLVFDFKSLYPSIIRTFKIDPVGMINGLEQRDAEALAANDKIEENNIAYPIPGFNGAYFHRHNHILPTIIEELWRARDQAKADNKPALSQAIKIIMNSFYGVLGSRGCRFFDPRLASSITLRGHWIIKTTKAWIEEQELEVLYGDTDSLFVVVDKTMKPDKVMAFGKQLAETLNEKWRLYLKEQFQIDSALELEFETLFTQFFMPSIRGSDVGSKKRYAGMKLEETGSGFRETLQFKGLETVRSDWTDLAKEIQTELYHRVFHQQEFNQYLQETVAALFRGELDELLVYKKRLRQSLQDYKRNIPPHAQAALMARNLATKATSTAAEGSPSQAYDSPDIADGSFATADGSSVTADGSYQRGSWVEYLSLIHISEPMRPY